MQNDTPLSHEATSIDVSNAYDCFTELAVHAFKAHVSLVTLIDNENNRQVFKSQLGLKEPWASRMETPLTHSFCQYVAKDDRVLCIEDATKSDLVKDNLAIAELGVMAYLGAPIRNKAGRAIGAFCVISGVPRVWNNEEKETISLISTCVSELMIAKED